MVNKDKYNVNLKPKYRWPIIEHCARCILYYWN